MPTASYPLVDLNPVALDLGIVAIRWYALAYIAGLFLGWRLMLRMAAKQTEPIATPAIDDFFVWATLGVILGGRVGFILFYQPAYYIENPLEAFMVWHGGMAFHGGLLGVMLAVWLFARRQKLHPFALGDLVATSVPIGVFFGRMANFVNGELYGRPWDGPWALVYAKDPARLPRHPSQLYEGFAEGIVLLTVLLVAVRFGAFRRRGLTIGLFLTGYGIARFTCEFFRQPWDPLLFDWMTRGQQLCVPMVLAGLGFIAYALKRPPLPAATGAGAAVEGARG